MALCKTGFVLTFCLLLSCQKPEKKAGVVVQSIKEVGRLVTAEYVLRKMVKASDNRTWYKVGNRRILISTEAVIKAGINLQAIEAGDVKIEGDAVQVRVPAPVIFSVSLPPEKITVQYEETSGFRDRFSAGEREALLVQAERQVRLLADSIGILQTAQANGEAFLRSLLKQGGYQTVTITYIK